MVFPQAIQWCFSNGGGLLCCTLGQIAGVLMFVCVEMVCLRLSEAKGSSQPVGEGLGQSEESAQMGSRPGQRGGLMPLLVRLRDQQAQALLH